MASTTTMAAFKRILDVFSNTFDEHVDEVHCHLDDLSDRLRIVEERRAARNGSTPTSPIPPAPINGAGIDGNSHVMRIHELPMAIPAPASALRKEAQAAEEKATTTITERVVPKAPLWRPPYSVKMVAPT